MKWWNDIRCFFDFHNWEHHSDSVQFQFGKSNDLVMVCVSSPSPPFSNVGQCASWRKCRHCGEVQICCGSKGLGGFEKEYAVVTKLDHSGIYADLLWNGRKGLKGCYKLMTVTELKQQYRNNLYAGIVYNEHMSVEPIPEELKRVDSVHGVRSIDDV